MRSEDTQLWCQGIFKESFKDKFSRKGDLKLIIIVLPIYSYLFFNSIFDNKVMTFIIVLLASACDFWTVKNVSGRYVIENGKRE